MRKHWAKLVVSVGILKTVPLQSYWSAKDWGWYAATYISGSSRRADFKSFFFLHDFQNWKLAACGSACVKDCLVLPQDSDDKRLDPVKLWTACTRQTFTVGRGKSIILYDVWFWSLSGSVSIRCVCVCVRPHALLSSLVSSYFGLVWNEKGGRDRRECARLSHRLVCPTAKTQNKQS